MPHSYGPSLPAEHLANSDHRNVVKKVSRRLLGFLFLCFVLSFLDRINIGSALNPLVVGWLKDLPQSFAAGIVYATALLVLGALLGFLLPVASKPGH